MAVPTDEEKRTLRQKAIQNAFELRRQLGEGYSSTVTLILDADQIYQYLIRSSDTPLIPTDLPFGQTGGGPA